MDWDDPMTKVQLMTWKDIATQLSRINQIAIPRVVALSETNKYDLLCFCDASTDSYAFAIYIRALNETSCSANLIFAKSRVRPNRPITIPKLELMAIEIGMKAINFVSEQIRRPIRKRFLWTDSQCALQWIWSKKQLSVFVENRVKRIRASPDVKIRFVPTAENPADIATRSKDIDNLTEMWWHGPSWIKLPENNWPVWKTVSDGDTVECHENKRMNEVTMPVHTSLSSPFEIDSKRFPTLQRLLKVTSLCLKAVTIMRKKPQMDEYTTAKKLWIRFVQDSEFFETKQKLKRVESSQLISQLGLYLDKDLIIRCSGRINEASVLEATKFPILLPPKHEFTGLIIKHFHERLLHSGPTHTLSLIRHEFWIIRGRTAVKTVLSHCLTCRKWEGGAFKLPKIPQLPKSRVTKVTPFSHTGLDYCGPLFIKDNPEPKKVWICVFMCLTVRAVHLELVEDMSAKEFLLCLRRFISRRETPIEIISDNALQFKASKTVVDYAWNGVLKDSGVESYSSNQGIKWKFIVELSPWMGGVYERLVGLIKRSLRKGLGRACLTYNQLNTLLAEVEAILNSRPIVQVENDINQGWILSPSKFLCLNPKQGIPTTGDSDADDKDYPSFNSTADILLEAWKKGNKHLDQFWKQWPNEYLLGLRQRPTNSVKQKKGSVTEIPAAGQVVLLKEELKPRGQWKIAKIMEIYPSKDGAIRSVRVRLPGGNELNRSPSHLYPLEVPFKSSDIGSAPTPDDFRRPTVLPGSKRKTKEIALQKIKDCFESEDDT